MTNTGKTIITSVALLGMIAMFLLGMQVGRRSRPEQGSHLIITITNLPPGVSNIIIYPAGAKGDR